MSPSVTLIQCAPTSMGTNSALSLPPSNESTLALNVLSDGAANDRCEKLKFYDYIFVNVENKTHFDFSNPNFT